MKKPKKLKKPKLPKAPRKVAEKVPFKRPKKTAEEKFSKALSDVPRITNETVTEHREEMLSSARKYIYPLQHSKRHIVRNSILILIAVVIVFLGVCAFSLYKLQSTGGFIYDVTRIVPFPVAKEGNTWISYESYLFELRRNMHYYHTQQRIDFSDKSGKAWLTKLKRRAMDQVVQDAYVRNLAKANHVTVSGGEVSDQIDMLREQNRLGDSNRVFRDVLSEFFGWSESDFRRHLKGELLQQSVVAKLDTKADARAKDALNHLTNGAKFTIVAKKMSDDASTRDDGGRYPGSITHDDADLSPIITAELFKLKPNQTSAIINTGYTLEIVKVLDRQGGKVHAAHIQFNLKSIDDYVRPLKDKDPPHEYIKV